MARGANGGLPRLALAVLLIQGFHVVEHVAQNIQRSVLGWREAHGLLGAWLDFEWVHFAYNALLLAGLMLLLAVYSQRPGFWMRAARAARIAFLGAVAVQGYHFIEHAVKIQQSVFLGVDPAPGILGHFLDLILLHMAFNVAVYALMVPLLVSCWRGSAPCAAFSSGSYRRLDPRCVPPGS